MALCPNCHKMDKEFFAPRCWNCNTEVGFGEQVAHSLVYTLITWAVTIGGALLIYFLLK
jgi:hypothetical protein